MLNFIIAIIVEAYMKVVKQVGEQESDQEFVTDVCSTLYATSKSFLFGWPGHLTLIKNLRITRKHALDYQAIRLMFPTWKRKGMLSFLHHYKRFTYMHPTFQVCAAETRKRRANRFFDPHVCCRVGEARCFVSHFDL